MQVKKKPKPPISRSDLLHSFKDCYAVEDAIWSQLQTAGCTERSSAYAVNTALLDIRMVCPAWVEKEAWDRIADSFSNWAMTFNSLELFWKLRRMKDD